MATLKNAPLQEVVFEVRWELDVNPENSIIQDSRFDLALGTFANSLSDVYPDKQKKNTQIQVQNQPMPYMLTHMFRKGVDGWPLVQIGPGIMTVNDREGSYNWSDYFDRIKMALEKLNKAYDNSIRFSFCSLRYIDSIKTKDYGINDHWDKFVSSKMNIRFENLFNPKGNLLDFSFSQIFELDHNNRLLLSVASGKDAESERLIWQTNIFRQQPVDSADLTTWAEDVHRNHASPLFKEMLNPDFYDSFS